MRLERFRTHPPELVEALVAPEALARYAALATSELEVCADPALSAHLRRMLRLAAQAAGTGLPTLAGASRGEADALLSELLAVLTWAGHPLPLEPLGEAEADPAGLPRGLLGADEAGAGAGVWLLDGATVGLARWRGAAERIEL
jgi:hypothetical protein